MSRGILYLALGQEFDKLTAASARVSRKFTDLPMTVITNLDERNKVWEEVPDVTFRRIHIETLLNRRIKVSLIEHTPYTETLFLDSDAVVQLPGIESVFSYLSDHDIVCPHFHTLEAKEVSERKFYQRTYARLAKMIGAELPYEMMGEAAFLFRQTPAASRFFDLWRSYWEMAGCGRDMPAFTFAVKNTTSKIKVFYDDVLLCTNREDESYFVQHKGFAGFEKKFGLPDYVDWSPSR